MAPTNPLATALGQMASPILLHALLSAMLLCVVESSSTLRLQGDNATVVLGDSSASVTIRRSQFGLHIDSDLPTTGLYVNNVNIMEEMNALKSQVAEVSQLCAGKQRAAVHIFIRITQLCALPRYLCCAS